MPRSPLTRPHASRRSRRRYDLCCGIGGDLLALAEHGETIGVERDPVTAYLAEANGRQLARHALSTC